MRIGGSPLRYSCSNMNLSKAYNAFQVVASSAGSVFLLDGGTGEELFAQGVPDDRKIWSATAVVNPRYHEILKQVHRSFLSAGAQAITTNSYGIIPGVGFSNSEIAEHCATAGRLAREAVVSDPSSSSTEDDALVFGSLGPLVESYRPDKIMEHQQGVEVYTKMVTALAPYVDAFLAETLSSTEEAMQAVEAVATTTSGHPMLISFTVNSTGALRSGETAMAALPRLLEFCKHQVNRTYLADYIHMRANELSRFAFHLLVSVQFWHSCSIVLNRKRLQIP
jgi:S-methylmethionine-dependent homocysteine/selenocysteine methylase